MAGMILSFQDVIFTDESRIEICNISRRSFRQKGQPVPRHPKPKHPFSVMVWGGISKKGRTDLLIFGGIMKAPFYVTKMLKERLCPHIQAKYPNRHRFQQDNDPKDISKLAKKYMEDHNINWLRKPAESPDLNPVENL
jgi:hypothetical protein